MFAMLLTNRHAFFVAVLAGILLLGVSAQAQSTQGMELLTQEEQQAFNHRLQHAHSSADRARITAEMNRIVQQRRQEMRQHEEPQSNPKSQGQGKAK